MKNDLAKFTSSLIATILLVSIYALLYDLIKNGKSSWNLIGFLFLSPMMLWAVVENAKIQGKDDLEDKELPKYTDYLEEE